MSAFLICFNRFHNYIVGEMAAINEGGRFSHPDKTVIAATLQATMPQATKDQLAAAVQKAYDAAVAKRDNDLFQTGRL